MPSPPSRRRQSRRRPGQPAVVLFPRTQLPCAQCGLCCTYVTAEIEPPTSVSRASRILWQLYHAGVSVYWDRAATWLVQFETRCRFFGDDRRCEIHAHRPQVCRDLDARKCEVNAADEGLHFHEPAQFLEWLAEHRPRVYARLMASDLVPDEDLLARPVPVRAPLAPFRERYVALRDLGADKVDRDVPG